MKPHRLSTAFLVTCLLLVCSQRAIAQNFATTGTTTFSTQVTTLTTAFGIDDTAYINAITNTVADTTGTTSLDSLIVSATDINTDIIDINIDNNTINNNTDPAVPEPTTLSLLAMSLLLVGRRWR